MSIINVDPIDIATALLSPEEQAIAARMSDPEHFCSSCWLPLKRSIWAEMCHDATLGEVLVASVQAGVQPSHRASPR